MRRWTAQDFSAQREEQVFYSKATCGRRFSASPRLFLPLVSYMCQRKKRNQGLLSFPHWPCQSFQRRQFLPHSQEMGPHGPGNSSVPANVFTQHSACSSRFARSPPLLSAPGKFITWEGSWLLLCPHPSWIIRADKQSGCAELPPPAAAVSAADRRFSSRQGWAGTGGLLQNMSQYSVLPVSGCFLSCLRHSPQGEERRQKLISQQGLWRGKE